jgi:hypothetical protein
MPRLRDAKSPTTGRWALYVSLGCEGAILAALLWGPEKLTSLEQLLISFLALCLLTIGLYYLLFRRTGVLIFSAEARLQDQLTKKLLEGDLQLRRVALVSRYDDWARVLIGCSFAGCGTLWLTLPQLGQLVWLSRLIVWGVFLSIVVLIVIVKIQEAKLALSDK